MPPAQRHLISDFNNNHEDSNDSPDSPQFVVRDARPGDCTEIFRLIYALAVYEKCEHKVTTTAEQLRSDGFGEGHAPRFHALVVERLSSTGSPVEIVGYSIYNEKYSTWRGPMLWIEDIYLAESYRKYGIGGAIMRKLASIANREGMDRIEWSVRNLNQHAIGFYQKVGAYDLTKEENWHLYRFDRVHYRQFLERPFEKCDFIKIDY